jgi:hypothetical protein
MMPDNIPQETWKKADEFFDALANGTTDAQQLAAKDAEIAKLQEIVRTQAEEAAKATYYYTDKLAAQRAMGLVLVSLEDLQAIADGRAGIRKARAMIAAAQAEEAAKATYYYTDKMDELKKECDALAGALEPFAKSGELLVNAGDSGKFWAYRPAGGDEYAITGGHLIAAHTTLAQHKGDA